MSVAVKILPHYIYEDYCKWEGQWELIEGIPYAMSPMPVPKHQLIAAGISSEFRIERKKCRRCNVYQPIDYKVKNDTILQPDVIIVCGTVEKQFLDFPPALVVEILSPSTALKDRHTKFEIYEGQQIKYYLIISPGEEEVEIYAIEDNIYQLKQIGRDFTYTFSFEADCTATIDFKQIW